MKFFLIDGSSFLYRAYYAFPQLSDKDWHNVNVVYGFFRMFLKIMQEKPEYLVITRDAPTKTQRHDEYPEYKANRKKMDDDFKNQVPVTKDIVEKLGIPNLVMPGYEADDIIYTLVEKYSKDKNLIIDIYSSDKDLKQLLDDNVFCLDAMKWVRTDTKLFLQEFMFEPKYILDYLALVGDASDNIKGINGIWPKKASDLIKKYQTIDNIYAHIDEISGEVKEKLVNEKEAAYKSRDLIVLRKIDEVEKYNLDNFKMEIDFEKFKKVLAGEYGFASFEKWLDDLKKKLYLPQQTGLF